jgi:hypothetical protein
MILLKAAYWGKKKKRYTKMKLKAHADFRELVVTLRLINPLALAHV